MRSKPAQLVGISLDFAGIPYRRNENFAYEHTQSARQGGIEFLNAHVYVLESISRTGSNIALFMNKKWYDWLSQISDK